MAHGKKFVTSAEIWTLYWVMIAAAVVWGALLAGGAWWIFGFNGQALLFLGMLTITAGLASGLSLYTALRRVLARVESRAENAALDLF